MGQGGALGGLGHFAIGIRANVFNGEIPDVASFTQSVNGAQRQTLPTEKHIVGLPTVDAAIGLFKGFPLALSNVGGIDLLLNASYVPTIDDEGVTITPKNNWSFGYGARLGLLQESLIVPGISVSWMKRDLPETDIAGSAGSGVSTASFTIDNFRVETSAWRVMASKSLVLFSLHAGVGQETYDQSADISASVSQPPFSGNVSVPDTEQKLTRTNFFGGVALNLMILKIVAEVGQSSGGTIETFNSFSGGRADRSQQYGSVGIRFGF
jgi:hypothetical protein